MNKLQISDSEWKVMEVAWSCSPVTAQTVISQLCNREDWRPQTVKTLISRLVKKGALKFETEGNRYHYSPAIDRIDAVRAETESFLDRISRGSLTPMLTHLVQSKRPLAEEELDALRKLLRNEEEDNT